ncbi:MAG TPA: putative LPS assembly protein LptD [Edaphocola sp.]|nr:putative LPS assembly protein LptD [Edaphocola sp.]
MAWGFKNKYYLLNKAMTIVLFIAFICHFNNLNAQTVSTDSISTTINDSTNQTDSNKIQSTQTDFASLGIKISPDAPDKEVNTSAKDSAVLDMGTNKFYLYGNASIIQDDIELKSGVVVLEQKDNIVHAYPEYDTSLTKTSTQSFKQGEETILFDSLRYNFKSKRALVRNAKMQYADAYINSFQIKRNPDQSIFGYKNLYTTCNLEHPHFGIKAKKIKVIPNKVAASGPANLEIADIPTPLMFPFGIFPINPQQKSGFILPTYNLAGQRGLGFSGLGYYFDINDYLGAKLTFDIYTKGSYGIAGATNYIKKYRYNGNLNISYTYDQLGEKFDANGGSSKNFKIQWNHIVDPKAMPGASFRANVDAGTSGFNRINGMNADIQTQNQYTSSVAYSKTWAGKPFSFSAALNHNQNTQTGRVNITLPDISFNVSQIMPFQNKNRIGDEKWYEKISVSYNAVAQNRYSFVDSNFSINNIDINDFSNGIKQSVNLSTTYNILRFINWSFNAPYTEYWNTKQIYRTWNPNRLMDDTTISNGFFASRDFNISTSLNTRIYGVKMFKKGKLMGIRHVINPSISVGYTPGFAKSPYNYFHDYYNKFGDLSYESFYQTGPYGGPGNPLQNGSIGFSINNNLQMKVRTNDSTGSKNISLLDNFTIRTAYNLAADSNNLSRISFDGYTNLFNAINLSFGGAFDPYYYDNGKMTKYYLAEKSKNIAQLSNFNISMSWSANGIAKNIDPNSIIGRENDEEALRLFRNNGINGYYDFNVPWNFSINSSLSYSLQHRMNAKDTTYITPSLTMSGSLRFTPKMMFNFTTGYDFVNKAPGATTFNITRDLHCWQMMLNLTPFGTYRNYNFTLNVKSAVLQDLKLTRKKTYWDNF